MSDSRFDRRTILKNALIGLAALPAVGLVREAAAADPHLEETDSLAKVMGYVHDASKVDGNKVPQFKEGSNCANCSKISGPEGEQWRPCTLFPGKLVNNDGWCKLWVPK